MRQEVEYYAETRTLEKETQQGVTVDFKRESPSIASSEVRPLYFLRKV